MEHLVILPYLLIFKERGYVGRDLKHGSIGFCGRDGKRSLLQNMIRMDRRAFIKASATLGAAAADNPLKTQSD